jgi:hypothetical protein
MDKSNIPLTDAEKSIFGHDARRRADGSIIEQGSSHDPDVVAHRAALDAAAAAAVAPARQIDMRTIHKFPERQQ